MRAGRAGRGLAVVTAALLAAGGAALAPAALAPAALASPSAGPTDRPVKVTTVRDPRIAESSGLAVSPTKPDVLWTVNDSGSGPLIYAVSSRTGGTLAVLSMVDSHGRATPVTDMESMATYRQKGRPAALLIGDTGDNRGRRSSVRLIMVREPHDLRSQRVHAWTLPVRYEGGPADAEALVTTPDGRVLILTKSPLWSVVYEVPAAAVARLLRGRDTTSPVVAREIARVSQSLVTGGASLADGRLVVRGYGSVTVYAWRGEDLVPTDTVALPRQKQGETIVVERGGRTLLVGSEGVHQPLWRVPLTAVLETPTPTETATATPSPSQPWTTTSAATALPDPVESRRHWPPVATAAGVLAAVVLTVGGLGAMSRERVRAGGRRGRRRR